MSAIDSSPTRRLVFAGLALAGLVNLGLMYVLPGAETVPFHLVWIGLSIIYGVITWRLAPMIVVLVVVMITTGYVLVHHAQMGVIGWEETTEVPLMTAIFVIMVWHVRRRQHMVSEVARLAETERRRAASQDRFVRLASHELRTPITIARGYAELVSAAAADPAIREDTRIVLEELDRLAGITQRLVTLVQMVEPYVQEVRNVDAALANVVIRWRPAADRRWAVRSMVGEASINLDRLNTALDCLVENAVKFTQPGDRIEVIGTGTSDAWTITVADSGSGMTPERLAEVNAGGSAKIPATKASGTGLGLAIVRAVVVSWGGQLRVCSAVDVGTTVTLHFPRVSTRRANPDVAAVPSREVSPADV
jgi:two-component system, OmpR family, sensor kinase